MNIVNIYKDAVPEELHDKLADALLEAVPNATINYLIEEDPNCPENEIEVSMATIDEGLKVFEVFYNVLGKGSVDE